MREYRRYRAGETSSRSKEKRPPSGLSVIHLVCNGGVCISSSDRTVAGQGYGVTQEHTARPTILSVGREVAGRAGGANSRSARSSRRARPGRERWPGAATQPLRPTWSYISEVDLKTARRRVTASACVNTSAGPLHQSNTSPSHPLRWSVPPRGKEKRPPSGLSVIHLVCNGGVCISSSDRTVAAPM